MIPLSMQICAYILIFFISISLYSQVSYTTGGTTEYLQSRFVNAEDRNKYDVFLMGKYKEYSFFGEKRENDSLGAFEYKNNLFYFSAGHRFKPIPGFYILRDKDFYSAFQNPAAGIIPQPMERSAWTGTYIKGWGVGIFMGKDISEKKPSFYIVSPNNEFAISYSPETKTWFSSLDFREKPIFFFSKKPLLTISSQMYGTRENNYGYFNTKLYFADSGIMLDSASYKEESGQVFVTSKDNFKNDARAKVHYIKLSRYSYDRLEFFESNNYEKIERIAGVNSSLISGTLGALCIGSRFYQNTNIGEKEKNIQPGIVSGSVSYEYRKNSTEFMLRAEKRQNGDILGEMKFSIRPLPDWKYELSILSQSDNNLLRTMYEQWSYAENINTVLTDRTMIIKAKLTGNFAIFNVSASRKKDGAGEIYFANIQFKMEF